MSSLTGMFVGAHALLAMRTNTPELVIEEAEAKGFLKAAENVAKHYSVQTTQKTLDWVAFIGAAGTMYGTRAFSIAARKQAEKLAAGEKVVNFNAYRAPRPTPEPEPAAVNSGNSYSPSVPSGEIPNEEFGGF